nr:cytochrome c oxidase subunit II [Chamelea striatula]
MFLVFEASGKAILFKVSFWDQFGFPDPATEMAGRLYIYHDLAMVVVVMVMVLVSFFLVVTLFGEYFMDGSVNRYICRNEGLEIFWTVTPGVFLFGLGYVSLENLYDMEVGDYVGHCVKVTGHQWYWEYQYEVNFSKEIFKKEHLSSLTDHLARSDYDYVKVFLHCNWMREKEVMTSEFLSVMSIFDDSIEMDQLSTMLRLLANDSYYIESDEPMEFLEFCDGMLGEWKEYLEFVELSMGITGDSVLAVVGELFLKGDWFLKYDSYLVPESELVDVSSKEFGMFRNQDVSKSCLLACEKKNEVLVQTADVMHSWGVPELGVKADAVPGRCNSVSVEPVLPGIMHGNCYELCGEGHSQMPITVTVMNYNDVITKVKMEIFKTEDVADFLNSL